MTDQFLQFAASFAAVAALVLLVHLFGFSAEARLASDSEAREMLRLAPGGFEPVELALDREGRGAIARDSGGRLALLVPHGGRFVARVLLPAAVLTAAEGKLTVACPTIGAGTVTLHLGPAAPDWATRREDAS